MKTTLEKLTATIAGVVDKALDARGMAPAGTVTPAADDAAAKATADKATADKVAADKAAADAITARTALPDPKPGFQPPATSQRAAPAVNGEGKPALSADQIEAARIDSGLKPKTRWAPYYMGEARKLGGPTAWCRKFAPGDRELIETVCQLHVLMIQNDTAGIRRLYAERALSEGIGGEGGFVVPEEFAQEVLMKEGELTPLATSEFVTVVPMNTDVKHMPIEETRPTVDSFAENTSGEGGTDPSFGEVELIARRQGRVLPISIDLVEDASIQVMQYLIDVYARIMAEKKNSLFTNGTGGGEPEGIRQASGVTTEAFTGTQTNSSDVFDWIEAIFWGPKAQYRARAIWLASSQMLETLSTIKDGVGRPILSQITDQPFQRLKGRPIFENNDIPDNLGAGTNESELIFGDFKSYLVGDRNQMRAETDSGGKYFENHQVALKVTEKYDGKVGQTEAFIRGTGKTVS